MREVHRRDEQHDGPQSPANNEAAAPEKQTHEEWREEFPYPWGEDAIMTRRDTLRFLPGGPGVQAVPIAKVGELTENEWRVFNFPDQYNQGILINLPGKGLVAYSDVCTHLSCAVIYQGDGKHLHCPCHEGLFDARTGNVLAGPPTRSLPLIELAIHDGTIYAVKVVPR